MKSYILDSTFDTDEGSMYTHLTVLQIFRTDKEKGNIYVRISKREGDGFKEVYTCVLRT